MRYTARQAEDRPQSKAVAGSEESPVGDRARQSSQRSVFAAQQIVSEIQGSEHVERAADDTDQCECVLVHRQRQHHDWSVTDGPLFRTSLRRAGWKKRLPSKRLGNGGASVPPCTNLYLLTAERQK